MLGAGGSSRAVLFGLLERGIRRIHLANRTMEWRSFAIAWRAAQPLAWDRSMALPRAGLLVNNSISLGMKASPLSIDDAASGWRCGGRSCLRAA